MDTSDAAPFAALLRRHRQAAGLSQAALAERAGLSVDAVAALERGRRTLPRPETVALLARALALAGADRHAFVTAAQRGGRPEAPPATEQAALPNPVTALIGREREHAELVHLLRHGGVRLLTVSGVGGVGKTRLAVAIAAAMRQDFADGVVFVDLSALRDPALVLSAVARAVGVREGSARPTVELLVRHLRARQTLLVLDNFEQVIAAASMVAAVVADCPRLAVLVTSRAALRLEVEHRYPLGPLALPEDGTAGGATAIGAPAVRLFLERAQAVRPDLTLTPETIAAMAAICRRLDGLPLAIELAAARIALLPPGAVLTRLSRRLSVLTRGARDLPDRQQTLRAALDWSYDLLSTEQQALFRRLAVFAGGGVAAAIQTVCGQADTLIPASLAALVEQSLLRTEGDAAERRFVLLETIREYATECLAHSGEAAALQQAHARYYLDFAERAAAEFDGPLQGVWLMRLEREHGNLRAALGWAHAPSAAVSATERRDLGLRLGVALWPFWQIHGHFSEGRAWLGRFLAMPGGDQDAEAVGRRAAALAGAGWLAHSQSDFEQAAALLEESLRHYRAIGHAVGTAEVLMNRGLVAHARGDYADAAALLEDSLARQRARGDRAGIGRVLWRLALVTRERGDYRRAAALYDECLALSRALGDRRGMAVALLGHSDIARDCGEVAETERYGEESQALFREMGERWGIACALNNLALAAYQGGDLARAATLAQESLAMFREIAVDSSAAEELVTLGRIADAEGDAARARGFLADGLRLAQEGGPRWLVAAALEGLASLAANQGDTTAGARLLGAAEALRERMGAPRWPADQARHQAAVARLRAALPEESLTSAWAQGRSEPLERTIAIAVAGSGTEPAEAGGWVATA